MAYDYSEWSGCVFPCPLCTHFRAVDDSPRRAWRKLYDHLRCDHDAEQAVKAANTARRNWQRSTR